MRRKHIGSGRAVAFIAAALLAASVIWWPAPYVDVSPLFDQHGRPDRPQHPASIYLPPGR